MFIKDVDLVYRAVSDAVAKIGGFSTGEELIGKTDYDIFSKELADKYRDDDKRVMETGIAIEGETERLPDADGEARWTQTWKHPLLDDSGKVIGIYGISRDITKTVELEAEAESVRKYVNLIDNIPGGVAIMHYTDGIVYLDYANDGFAHIHHRSLAGRDGAVGHRVIDGVYELDRAAVLAECERLAASDEGIGNVDYRTCGDDGGLYWVNVRFRFVYGDGGTRYYYASYTDIDRQKKDEDADRERYLTEQAYIDSLGDAYLAVSRVNLTKNIVETAKGPDLVYKAGPYDDMHEAIVAHILKQHDRDEYLRVFSRENLLEGFRKGINNVSLDYYSMRSDGRPLWIRSTMSLARQPETGDVVGFVAGADINIAKITEIIATEVLMGKFECISYIRGNRNSSVTIKADGVDTSAEVGDYAAEVERYARAHVSQEDREAFMRFCAIEGVLETLDAGGACEAMFWVDEGDGPRRKKLDFYYLDRENALLAFIREDVTEQYNLEIERERQLTDALRKAEEASRARSELFSRMSHDMRTPLNGIIGMTYLTQKLEMPDEVRGNLAKIDTSSKFLLGLINDILDMTKAESSEIELHTEPYPTSEFHRYLDAVIRPLCEAKRLDFVMRDNQPEGIVPLFDKLRINQVLFNLLSNAAKFTPEGGTVTLDVHFGHHDELGRMPLHVTVSDTGIGMTDEFQKVLFEPFAQEEREGAQETRGTGLGLPIAKRLVELMGGTIIVESVVGSGTTFTIDMVVSGVPADSLGKQDDRSVERIDYEILRGKRVLLCEDHPLNQEIAVSLLEGKGMVADVADNGQIGVNLFAESEIGFYDVVLMDIRMPVMDGYQAARTIRALDRADARTVPIIAMTADAFPDDVRRCFDAGMDGHIAKPIEPDTLFRTLEAPLSKMR